MVNDDRPQFRPPWWYIALIVIGFLPVFMFPAMIAGIPAEAPQMKMFVWFFPLVQAACAWFAYKCYNDRTSLAAIMLAFMYLIDLSMLYLFIL